MRRIPPLVLALFTINLVLILLPVIDYAAGSPFAKLRNFFYLDAETTLQAWYSSMQWFLAASLFGAFALYAYRSRLPGMLAIVAVTGLCMAFSGDEIARNPERLGERSDAVDGGAVGNPPHQNEPMVGPHQENQQPEPNHPPSPHQKPHHNRVPPKKTKKNEM